MTEIESTLNAYFEIDKKLSSLLNTEVNEIEDLRNHLWNGDVENPSWGEDKVGLFFADGRFHTIKDGIYFIYAKLSSGDKGWIVFREDNIVKNK